MGVKLNATPVGATGAGETVTAARKETSKGRTLVARGASGTLSYRRRVPADLRELVGKTEIVRSLRTSQRARAEALAARIDRSLGAHFSRLRAGAVTGYRPELRLGDYRMLAPKLIQPGTVDLVLTDLPYARNSATATGHQWDQPVNLEEYWSVVLPLLSPTGTVITTAVQPLTTDLINSQRALFRDMGVWIKSRKTRILSADRLPLREHEDIVVFARPHATYNRVASIRRDGRRDTSSNTKTWSQLYRKETQGRVVEGARRQATTVIRAPSISKTIHPTEKPVALWRELIGRHSNPGDLILEPFAGSASVLEAAWLTGRRSVGFEVDAGYFQEASARLDDLVSAEIDGFDLCAGR